MKRTIDISRIFRIAMGLILVAGGLWKGSSIWIAGIIPLISGITNKCPSFLPGSSSCGVEPEQKENLPKIKTEKIKID